MSSMDGCLTILQGEKINLMKESGVIRGVAIVFSRPEVVNTRPINIEVMSIGTLNLIIPSGREECRESWGAVTLLLEE